MRILLLNGPNLGRLGLRQPEIYGSTTLVQVIDAARERAAARGSSWKRSSRTRGRVIDRLEQRDYGRIVINPGALTHYSYASTTPWWPPRRRHRGPHQRLHAREPWRGCRSHALP